VIDDSRALSSSDAIAIVGMSGRFPRAGDVHALWVNLLAGRECISFATETTARAAGLAPSLLANPSFVRAWGTIEATTMFDAQFFGYNPREAQLIDPQQRVFLECAWEALETAGYDPKRVPGRVGVFAGSGDSGFAELVGGGVPSDVSPQASAVQIAMGKSLDCLSTRVSYKLNLHGPSLSVQTACSTSLVAVHLARQSLLRRESDLALAGGARIVSPQPLGYLYEDDGIMSPDGHCRAFDDAAAGTVCGCGAGIVVLKRLGDALAANDHIYALIIGSAINNDGSGKLGFTAPSVSGQADVIRDALQSADVGACDIGYVEAHGTGTRAGDPIEIAALTKVFAEYGVRPGACLLGSVKTNIGHLDTAAGIAGLIKTVLALHHEHLPASLHFTRHTTAFDVESSPFRVNGESRAWPRGDAPRRAGVSAFGIGGTNAHVILEEAPPPGAVSQCRPYQVIPLSACSESALQTTRGSLARHIRQNPDVSIADIGFTMQVGRHPFAHRLAFVARDRESLLRRLEGETEEYSAGCVKRGARRTPVFAFPGVTAQYVNMGRDLYTAEVLFREKVDQCAAMIQQCGAPDFRPVLYASEARGVVAAQQAMRQATIAMPALFTVEYATMELLSAWGIRPEAVVGHSVGEYAAAVSVGALSLEDAVRLVTVRASLVQSLPPGAMLAVALSEREASALLRAGLSLAAINGPSQCVLSGHIQAVDAVKRELDTAGVWCRLLDTPHALHSEMLDPILEEFSTVVRSLPLKQPNRPYVSASTGEWIGPGEIGEPEYWVRHLREPVRFSQAVGQLLEGPDVALIEIGPGDTLTALASCHPGWNRGHIACCTIRSQNNECNDQSILLTAVGKLWCAGVEPDWSALSVGETRRRVGLPTYPFERQDLPLPGASGMAPAGPSIGPATRGRSCISEWYSVPTWRRALRRNSTDIEFDPTPQWVVFSDGGWIGDGIVRAIRARGEEVFVVLPGTVPSRPAPDNFVLDPDNDSLYAVMWERVLAHKKAHIRLVHCWSLLTPDTAGSGDIDGFVESQRMGFQSLLSIARAYGDTGATTPLRVHVISCGAFDVIGGDGSRPEGVMASKVAEVWALESPNVTCRNIDLAPADVFDSTDRNVIDALISQFRGDANEKAVAYRNRRYWELDLVPIQLEAVERDKDLPVRRGGVYLITGGLGGIGMVLARALAERFGARVALTGRSKPPNRSEWTGGAFTDGISDWSERTLAGLAAIERCGGEVLPLCADAASESDMRGALERTIARFGRLDGVIHAAGVAGGRVAQLTTVDDAQAILAPKTVGALVLQRVLAGRSLDFVVLCSSINAFLSAAGQSAYCAASAFMDGYAARLAADHRVLTINWCGWSEVGMIVSGAGSGSRRPASESVNLITSSEGVESFWRGLASGYERLAIYPSDLAELIARGTKDSQQAVAAHTDGGFSVPNLQGRPHELGEYCAPANALEEQLASLWQELLGVGPIGVLDSLLDLGGHSLLAIRLVGRIQHDFGVRIPVAALLRAPTVRAVAEQVTELVVTDVRRLSDAEAAAQL